MGFDSVSVWFWLVQDYDSEPASAQLGGVRWKCHRREVICKLCVRSWCIQTEGKNAVNDSSLWLFITTCAVDEKTHRCG